jgi:aryl-alcohol dehydrogenase-like predicted oxidoreductase
VRYRTLGSSGIECSEVGFGAWTVSAGWWGQYTDDEAVALLRRAYDLGVTLFDTAPTYGDGRGETLLPKALRGVRDRVVYSTKVGYDTEIEWTPQGHQERPHRVEPTFLRRAVEASLRRLGTDVIDVLQLHNPRLEHLRRDDVWELLEALRGEGKVRAYGIALGPAIGWRDEGLWAIENREMRALQMIHNLLEQDPGRDFLAAARARGGIGIMARVPHSSGLLEGKYTEDTTFDANDHRSHRKREWLTAGLKKLEKLDFLTRKMTIGQAALKWLLAEPLVTSVLPNIYDAEQLEEFAAAPDLPDLPAGDVARVNGLYERSFDLEPASADA